jgi:hypothetical protein
MSDEQPENPFPPEVKEAFFDYITAGGYTNRERVPLAKIMRYLAFLNNLDLKPTDRSDSKIKFEARHFYELIDNRLHRQHDKTHPNPRYLVPQNKAFDIIVSKHLELGHPGRNLLFHAIDQEFYGIKREECHWVKAHCLICMRNSAHKAKAPTTTVHQTFERVQVDLIDMRHQPSGEYSWVLHIKDHCSKYTQLYALRNKHAESIAESIAQFIMAFFPINILQCNNGKEFKGMSHGPGILSLEANNIPGALLILLRRYGVKLLLGSPCTPQAQALAEQANSVVEDKLARWKVDYGSPLWHLGLAEIAVQMNSQLHSTTKPTVFDVAFRQNMPKNWLTCQERRDAEGVECENGGILTEATLSKELQEENDEEVLEALSGIRDLGVVVSVMAGFDTSAQAAQLYQRTPEDNAKDVLGSPSKAILQPDAQASPVRKGRQEPSEHVNPPSSSIEPLNQDFSMGDEGPELVTILAKPPPIQPKHFAPGRPIAHAEIPDGDLDFHNQEIPHAHMLLIFRGLDKRELMRPIPGGQLDYTDPHEKNFNVATLINGQLFHWPKDLVSHDNLKRPIPPRELQRLPKGIEDTNQVHGRIEKTSLEQVAREASSSDDEVADSTKLDMTVSPAKAKERKRQRSSSTEETITVDVRRTTTVSKQ